MNVIKQLEWRYATKKFNDTAVLADEGVKQETYSLWLGGHYTEFDDGYNKKIGEFEEID